jgi:hypothetical protein
MEIFRVNYTVGNGYTCSCCSSFYDESQDFDTIEETLQYAAEKYFEDDSEFMVQSIERIADTEEIDFENLPMFQKFVAEEKERIEDAERKRKEEEKKKKEERKIQAKEKRRQQYEKLREEFED